MLDTIQSRRIQADFDINTGMIILPDGIKLSPRDTLQFNSGIEEVVALKKSIFELLDMPPSYVVTAQRANSDIALQTYMLGEKDGKQFLARASNAYKISTKFPFYHFFDKVLKEAKK